MTGDQGEPNEALMEMAASPFRESDPTGRVLPSPAWHDLTPEARERLFELQVETRALECAIDPDGLSGTARGVISKIRDLGLTPLP